MLIIGPDPFFPLSSPGHSPQPKIDSPYHEISGPDICSLICESDFYLTRLKILLEKKKNCIDYGLYSDAFACTIRFECKADQFGLGYKELTEGKVDVVCMYKN